MKICAVEYGYPGAKACVFGVVYSNEGARDALIHRMVKPYKPYGGWYRIVEERPLGDSLIERQWKANTRQPAFLALGLAGAPMGYPH